MSIFEGSEGLHLDTSLQHLEEDEAEEDQKRRNKEVLQPVSCRVCVCVFVCVCETFIHLFIH
jgi:hypothetical protein